MNWVNKENFLQQSTVTLEEIYDELTKLSELSVNDFKADQTALVIIDMINGFAKKGALQSPRVEGLIPEIVTLMQQCNAAGLTIIAFADYHTEASPEFESYPAHCLTGSEEAEIVDEIKEVGRYTLIRKNSTNGFLEPEFQNWLQENQQIHTFILTGDCTDICILQFALTLKAWFNRSNQKARIIVPMNNVETFDLGLHQADLMNMMALVNMMGNGIEVVRAVRA